MPEDVDARVRSSFQVHTAPAECVRGRHKQLYQNFRVRGCSDLEDQSSPEKEGYREVQKGPASVLLAPYPEEPADED